MLFFFGGPTYYSPRSFQSAWNIGHLIFFAMLPLLLFYHPILKRLKPMLQALIVTTTTLLLGVTIEYLQYGFDRTPDTGDILRNMIGAMIAIFFFLPIRKAMAKHALTVMKCITILLAAAQFYPIVIALADEHQARRSFPVLADFQTPQQIKRLQKSSVMSLSSPPDEPENTALRADLTTRKYSGVSLNHFPRDWQGYQFFQFRVFNPSPEDLTLTCRIHDKHHRKYNNRYQDRYNKTHTIRQGWNTITTNLEEVRNAPEGRKMDMQQIYGIGIFAIRLPYPRTVFFDDLRLF